MKIILIIVGILILAFVIAVLKKRTPAKDEWLNYDDKGSENNPIAFDDLGRFSDYAKNCPNCGLEAQKLDWFKYRSSDYTWRNLIGRAGFQSKCPKCDIEVDDIIECMN